MSRTTPLRQLGRVLREVIVSSHQGDVGSEFLVAHSVFVPQGHYDKIDSESLQQRLLS